MATKKQAIGYYRNKDKVKRTILNNAKKKGHIVFGARAVNQQVRKPLRKSTEDYDIFSKTPKKTAKKVERKLDKSYGFNAFETKPALHPGTWKIKNKVTLRGVADYSKPPKPRPRTIRKKGVNYTHTSHQLKQIRISLKDPKSKFRHDKDIETRQRIALNKKFRAERKKKKTPIFFRSLGDF